MIHLNVTIHDTYITLLALPNTASNPDGITGRLLGQLAPVLA